MRIRARVAMSGKVLAARRNARRLESRDDGSSEPGDILSAFGQRTIADHGVLWIREDVQNRSVVERNADRFELGGQRPGEARCQLLISAPPERLHRRPQREWRLQPRDSTALLIDAHPEGQLLRKSLRLPRHLSHLIRGLDISREENDAAQVELARDRSHFGGNLVTAEARDRQLTDVSTDLSRDHRASIIGRWPHFHSRSHRGTTPGSRRRHPGSGRSNRA